LAVDVEVSVGRAALVVVIDEREIEAGRISISILPHFLANQTGTDLATNLSLGIDHFLQSARPFPRRYHRSIVAQKGLIISLLCRAPFR